MPTSSTASQTISQSEDAKREDDKIAPGAGRGGLITERFAGTTQCGRRDLAGGAQRVEVGQVVFGDHEAILSKRNVAPPRMPARKTRSTPSTITAFMPKVILPSSCASAR